MRLNKDRNKGWFKGVTILLLAIVLTACSQLDSSKQEVRAPIDPPPADIEKAMIDDAIVVPKQEVTEWVTVYLRDQQGLLAPMTLQAGDDSQNIQAIASSAIQWMTVNQSRASQLPLGFKAILPEGTKLSSLMVNKEDRSLSVDFAAPFPKIPAAEERQMLEALVWTLTELPGIDKVKLSIGEQPISSMPSGKPVDQVLTRGYGINLETAPGTQFNRSMAVTLYFQANSIDGEAYYVPVTRLINRQADATKAALEQLIIGPLNSEYLNSTLAHDTTIEKLSRLADTVHVSLRDASLDKQTPAAVDQLEALVLTLTEASGAPQVKVVRNGDYSEGEQANSFDEITVVRPTHINTLQR